MRFDCTALIVLSPNKDRSSWRFCFVFGDGVLPILGKSVMTIRQIVFASLGIPTMKGGAFR